MNAKGNTSTTSIILRTLILSALLAVTVSDDLWAEQKSKVDKSVKQPYAYLFPETLGKLTEHLQREGVEVNELREDIELDVEVYGQAC